MRKIIALILSCTLLLSSCAVPQGTGSSVDNIEVIVSEESSVNAESINDTDIEESESQQVETITEDNSLEMLPPKEVTDIDFDIKGLDDENLLRYVEDSIYEELISYLDSEDVFVESVEAIYYPKEYIEATISNSKANEYFGYTAAELNEAFQGTKYVFTLGDDGQTIVVPMETLDEDVYAKAMENVIIGTGVILVSVTVSFVTAPALPAVSMIFATSASTGTIFALQSGSISFAAAAIVKGYETEDFEQAMKAGAEAGSEGFKWGAIIGSLFGGGKEALALKGATLNGLTMNEAALIQKESGFPLEVIKQIKSMEEYLVYKDAGLYTKLVNGKLALVRNIDLEYVSELPNGEKVTNFARMLKGYAPIDPATGKAYQLHHINQDPNGTLAILTEAEHQGNSKILNIIGKESEINRSEFDKIRQEFWKKFAKSLS